MLQRLNNLPGITWRGPCPDDVELLRELPQVLVDLLAVANGFILHHGALHVRGANLSPDWHSLRAAWKGPKSLHKVYEQIKPTDIPFAQDQVGDQFLLRDHQVICLRAETGEVEPFCRTLDDFFIGVRGDIEAFLNVSLNHQLKPGELLFAYPPFCMEESAQGVSLKPVSAMEVISVHADLARQIRDIPDGGKAELRIKRN